MKNVQSKTNSDRGSGLRERGGLGTLGEAGGEKMEDSTGSHQRTSKRMRYDREGNLLVSKGILIRKDIDKKYDIKSAISGVHKYQLVNDALIYYYEKVLNKSQSERLKEAGVGELGI